MNILIAGQGAVLDLKCLTLQVLLTKCLRKSCRVAGEKNQAFSSLAEESEFLDLRYINADG